MNFGCVCVNGPSHFAIAAALSRALEKRGHQFTFFGPPHMKPRVEQENVTAYFMADSPEMANRINIQAKDGQNSFGKIVIGLTRDARYLHREVPAAIKQTGVDCMLIDANLLGAASAAEACGLPFLTFCCALPQLEEAGVPPTFLPWHYRPGLRARLRNRLAYRIRDYLVQPLMGELNSFRQQHRLPRYRGLSGTFSTLAQVSQLIPEFDFPRKTLPECFHYVGPYYRAPKSDVSFPYERLDGRRLVYSSLGHAQGTRWDLWNTIAKACETLDVQLVIALGTTEPPPIGFWPPGNPIVVPYAPQEALLAKASLFITHAGLNSAMESLCYGVPMVALPFLGDQMGVASRIVFHGVGLSIGRERNNPDSLRKVIAHILENPAYRERCRNLASVLPDYRGAARAAEIFERAALTRQPVLRTAVEGSVKANAPGGRDS